MEFVIVTFPTRRGVNVDGAARGQTGRLLRLQAGTHIFDLGVPADYAPASQMLPVIGTSVANPLEVAFEQAGRRRAPPAPRPEPPVLSATARRAPAKAKTPRRRKSTTKKRVTKKTSAKRAKRSRHK